jgi:Cu/Ag efflux pump CusA
MNMLENHSDISLSKTAMKTKMAEIIDRLTVDQPEHFSYALEQVASCYLNSSSHGALLIANEKDESQSLVAINASEIQISEMVGFMAEAIQGRHSSPGGMYVN